MPIDILGHIFFIKIKIFKRLTIYCLKTQTHTGFIKRINTLIFFKETIMVSTRNPYPTLACKNYHYIP